jgi:hypothetical protein
MHHNCYFQSVQSNKIDASKLLLSVSSIQHTRCTITVTVSQFHPTHTTHHNYYSQSVQSNTQDAILPLLTKLLAQEINPKLSTLAEHKSVLCSLWLGAEWSDIVGDSCWRYSDVQMHHTKLSGTFVPDIKILNLVPPQTTEFLSVLCVFRFSIQIHTLELFRCYCSLISTNYKEA